MIRDCSFEELGNRFYWDLQDIPSILGTNGQAQMKAVLEGFATCYFSELKNDGCINIPMQIG